jgi:hypothetical protein
MHFIGCRDIQIGKEMAFVQALYSHTAISIKVVHEQSGKVEYERGKAAENR